MKTLPAVIILGLTINAHATNLVGQKIGKDPQTVAVTGTLANESGLTYTKDYVLDAGPYTRVSAQVNYGTVTYAASTFSSGATSTGSFTVVSTSSLAGKYVTINRVVLTAGTDFAVGASVSITATNLAAAINANYLLKPIMSAQGSGALVTATSTYVGGNFALASNTSSITVSGANMTGGYVAYYSSATDIINVPSHGFNVGLPVLYSGTPAIGGLTTGTTYFAVPIDVNNIYLATSKVLAVAGVTHVNITVQLAPTSAATYTLAPLDISGSPAFAWYVSNDGVNYTVSSSTGGMSVADTGTGIIDFEDFDYRYLKMAVTGPTTGAIKLQSYIHAKQN
jgi:hypothetical protein